jgi:uroporphyrinogen decarboxylase
MRQAGRYLPGYQKVRAQAPFLEMCRRPDLAAEVTLEPIERFGMDGAVVFSDILIPLEAMGVRVEFDERGPLCPEPVRDADAIARMQHFDPREGTPWILETLERLVEALPPEIPPIGFAGAPFTLAAYAVEGRITKSLVHVMGLRWRDPDAFAQLLTTLADSTAPYLAAQAHAGAGALQLFDTWAGMMSRDDWRDFGLPAIRRVFDGVRELLGDDCPPLVLYTKGTAAWFDLLPESGADAFSVDWRLPLGEAKRLLGGRPVQGNLDPTCLHSTPEQVRAAARAMLATVEGQDGVVANLGHGVIVGTPPENVAAFVDEVQNG